jgi:RNA polymerase sigma factor (sigma-70 family)
MAVNVAPERATAHGEAENLAAHLYATHSDRILRYCAGQLRNRAEAEDAVQSTFLTALRALREGVVPRYELAWLLKIAENVCRTQRRNASYRSRFEDAGESRIEELVAAPEPHGLDLLRLTGALARLPDSQRSALLLREWRGFSCREIAETLGTTVTAIEMLLFRARRNLAGSMSDEPAKPRRGRIASALNLGQLLPGLKGLLSGAFAADAAVGVAVVALVPFGPLAASPRSAVQAAPDAAGAARRGPVPAGPASPPARVSRNVLPTALGAPPAVLPAPLLSASEVSPAAPAVPDPVVTAGDQGGLPTPTGMPAAEPDSPSTVALPAPTAAQEGAEAAIPLELPIVPIAPAQIATPDVQLPQLPAAIALP